jgi:hypothetical protein
MKNYNKLMCISAFISIAYSLAGGQEIAFNTDLGKSRMFEIMETGPEGLVSFYKNITLAETLNLALDLNLEEISERFDCMLLVGRKFLLNAFDHVVSPKDQSSLILDNQHAISVIKENSQLREQLHHLLAQAAEHEAVVVKFLQQKQDVLEKLPKGFLNKIYVKSPIAQAMNQAKWATVGAANGYVLKTVAPFYEYFYKKPEDLIQNKKPEDFDISPGINDKSYPDSFWKNLPNIVMQSIVDEKQNLHKRLDRLEKDKPSWWAETEANFVRREKDLAAENFDNQYKKDALNGQKNYHDYCKSQHEILKKDAQREILTFERALSCGYNLAYGIVITCAAGLSYSLYKMYSIHQEGLKIRDLLYAINQLISIAEQIEMLCKQHGIKTQFALSSIDNDQTLDLMSKLKADRYSNNNSIFVASSATRAFMYEVYEKDMHLAPIFAAVAEMDALHAIADKMVATENSANRICFSKFIDTDRLIIDGDAYWNLLVKNPVHSSLHEERNVILTGPNAGGKSTTVRAILQNILLAQTFGVAAASKFELTQFDVLHSLINVSDDILGGKSLFATEVQCAQDIMQRIKKLQFGEKYFFALDELFTGTNAEAGEMCACKFIENIANNSNIKFVYATHFNKLTEIGTTHKNCANYRIDAPEQNESGEFIRNAQGKLIYPYTLSKGANNISVAKEIAYDAGLF